MNKILLLFIFVFFVSSCDQHPKLEYAFSRKEIASNMLLKRVAVQLKKDNALIAIGTGGGMMRQIHMLALSFEYRRPIRACEGRELLMTAVNALLSEINTDEEIRSYLIHYPFLPKDIEIRIFLTNPDRSDVACGELSILSSLNGKFEYDIRDSQTMRLVTAYQETYAEALNRIEVHSAEPQELVSPVSQPPVPQDPRIRIGFS